MQLVVEAKDEIEAHLLRLGWLTPDERLVALSKPGEGNMNRTLRADTGERTFVLKQSVPYVAKYPDIAAPIDRLDAERQFYDAIKGTASLMMRTPQILGYDPDHHLLSMQDLGNLGDFTSAYARKPEGELSSGEITALVYWLWKLHSVEPPSLANTEMRKLNHAHIFEIPLQSDNGVALEGIVAEAAAELRADEAVCAAARELGEIYLGKRPHASRPALLHGDFYPGSWLSHPTLGAAIIDPEFAFVGPPEFDLGVMVAHLTFCHYTQADLMNVFRSYVTPPDFEFQLAMRFAGMEIIRRLLGVAQLPLTATPDVKSTWLGAAKGMLLT